MAQTNSDSQPPPTFRASVNAIEISAEKESKVTGVTVYTGRAEVTREVKFSVETGQNKITILHLSSSLDAATLRVEGRGAGTIQGVTISMNGQPPTANASPIIENIQEKQGEIEAAIDRCTRNRDAVYKYLETLDAQHVGADKLSGIIQASEENLERLDTKIARLKKELGATKKEIDQEKARLNPPFNHNLRNQVEIGVFADQAGEVVLVLKYFVLNATWDAAYDLRANTQTNDNPVKLIYQAKVTQGTGENWIDVPILLETNTPTTNVNLPALYIERLEAKEKPKDIEKKRRISTFGTGIRKRRMEGLEEEQEESDGDMGFGLFDDGELPPPPPGGLAKPVAIVYNKGAVSTTYKIPGLVTIPSDSNRHNITIAELELDAVLSWLTIPKVGTQAHLQAQIKNTSDFILLNGGVNIYVDGAFNSTSFLSTRNPQETFKFSLGIDPTLRITYHPCVEKSSQSGLITKTATTISTQRITIQNTRLVPISLLKVIDGIPVSKDARITVKLKTPELVLPSPGIAQSIQRTISSGTGTGSITGGSVGSGNTPPKDDKKVKGLPAPTKVSDKPLILAQWDGADAEDVQVGALGQDGQINWVISDLGSMETVNVTLTWEVSVVEGWQAVASRVYRAN
ncbi:hypothetical protein P691DRAFT_775622 [Macrolepiota fuliginosa MF-IS2]|uniref:Mucoidy inhibitor A n=1 Tax=Macrolepiota fuliginosa MF-IS2 TaxID=1400762 RepID=A0A9P6C4D1_9AGAR|nr:hypothetical protein P691DRAFT_775622 [Macrolepiota fuliginosa MF-IS2]